MATSNISMGRVGPVVGTGSPRVPAIINPLRSEAAERFIRSQDSLPLGGAPGGGGGSTQWPLQLVKVDASNVKVLLGTVQGFTPTGIATNIDVHGTNGTWTIYMHATLSGATVTAVEVLTDSSGGPVPADDATNSYRLIGQVDVASGAITAVRPSMAWSMAVTICTSGTPPYSWTTGA